MPGHVRESYIEPVLQPAVLVRLVGVAAATSTASYAVPVVLAFAVLRAGGSSAAVGVVLAADTAGTLGTLLVGGALADRLPRARLMAASELAAALLQAAAVAALARGAAPLPFLAFLQAATGASRGFFHPAMTGLVACLVPRPRLQGVNGVLGMAEAGARLGGPPVAGLLLAVLGPEPALLAVAATFAVSAILLLTLSRREPAGPRASVGVIGGLRRGWKELASREILWVRVRWSALIAGVGQAPLLVLGPAIAEHELGGAAAWGLALGALGAGAAAGGALAATVRVHHPLPAAILAYTLYALPLV